LIGLSNNNTNNPPNGQQQQQRSPQVMMTQQHQQTPQQGSPGQLYMRPLPDRPYSVTGQYTVQGAPVHLQQQAERRSFPVEGYTGYLSSPERRLPNGQIVRNIYAVGPNQQQQPLMYDDGIYGYGSRPSSVLGVLDDAARAKMENMERQLANLTGLVQAALVQSPPSTNDTTKGKEFPHNVMLCDVCVWKKRECSSLRLLC
jgi:hypothetical protein